MIKTKSFLFVICMYISSAYGGDVLPTTSNKDIESKVASLLKEKLQLNSSLEFVNNDSDDLITKTIFEANNEHGTPQIAILTDTEVLIKSEEGRALSSVINFTAIPNVNLRRDKNIDALNYVNNWNSKYFPVRLYVAKNKVIASINLVTTKTQPQQEETLVSGFLAVSKVWKTVVSDLKRLNILEV